MFFDNLGVWHFEFKMADILTQNHKLPLIWTITMQYKIKAPETVAMRDSWKCEWRTDKRTDRRTDGHRYDNTKRYKDILLVRKIAPVVDRSRRGGKNGKPHHSLPFSHDRCSPQMGMFLRIFAPLKVGTEIAFCSHKGGCFYKFCSLIKDSYFEGKGAPKKDRLHHN